MVDWFFGWKKLTVKLGGNYHLVCYGKNVFYGLKTMFDTYKYTKVHRNRFTELTNVVLHEGRTTAAVFVPVYGPIVSMQEAFMSSRFF